MTHHDRRILEIHLPQPSGRRIGETMIQGGCPVIEDRRWREELIATAQQGGALA